MKNDKSNFEEHDDTFSGATTLYTIDGRVIVLPKFKSYKFEVIQDIPSVIEGTKDSYVRDTLEEAVSELGGTENFNPESLQSARDYLENLK